VECGDAGDGVVDRVAAASAWAQDLVVFESGDGVFCDGSVFTESAVVAVCDDAAAGPAAWRSDAVAAAVAAVPGRPRRVGERFCRAFRGRRRRRCGCLAARR
jgi:hypothetical protein